MGRILNMFIMASNVSHAVTDTQNVSNEALDCECESGNAIESLSYGGTVSAETVYEVDEDGSLIPLTTFKIKLTQYYKERLIIRRGISFDKAKSFLIDYAVHKRA
jgi:hypothetical protein